MEQAELTVQEQIKRLRDTVGKPEDLSPELSHFLVPFPALGKGAVMIQHPLVYSVPHHPGMNAMVNESLKRKREYANDALANRELMRYVFVFERPYRLEAMNAFLETHNDYGFTEHEGKTFWEAVASMHTDSENIGQNIKGWRRLWTQQPSKRLSYRHFATEQEDWEKLNSLGNRLTVYHGNVFGGEIDLSWSLDKGKAIWFALRFGPKDPVLYTGEVERQNVIAYLTGRGEEEIVSERRHVITKSISHLPTTHPYQP